MDDRALSVLEDFERALFAGEDIRPFFHPEAFYEMSGDPPIGGRFEGVEAIYRCFEDRLVGLGPGLSYQDVSRVKYAAAGGKAIAEIHEKSWLPEDPEDVLEIRTCSVVTVKDGKILSLIDYTDSGRYTAFLQRHRASLPKFQHS